MSGKTRDDFYNKFALPIFLAAFGSLILGGGGYIYSKTPEGEKKVAQTAKTLKETKNNMLATVYKTTSDGR